MDILGQELSTITLTRSGIETLQVNLGMLCNQACVHCHHNAGPARTELMPAETCRRTLAFFEKYDIPVLELTGGAPELNPNFKDTVCRARAMGRRVIVRSNLTVLFEDGMEGLPTFFAENNIELVCSMPCYIEQNVDAQRGHGVYKKSIAALKMLNDLGYGMQGTGLSLYLVYNPGGSFLPGDQPVLEDGYKQSLNEAHGIMFNHLYTITNMPIGRFAKQLHEGGLYKEYIELLRHSVNPDLLHNAMCRNLISVGWDGRIYDCDFNQALKLPIGGEHKRIWEYTEDEIMGHNIILSDHCYGCIAGSGSSCTGSLERGSMN